MASSPAPSGKQGRKKNPDQAFFIPLEEEESHDRVFLIQHQQTLDKEIVMYRNKEDPVMCPEAVSLFEGFSDILITQSLDKHFVFKHLFICVDQQVNEAELQRVLKTSLVWFSSQLSWQSSYTLSRKASWHHQRMTSVFRDDRHRSGWMYGSCCTTRLLCRTQHSYCCCRHFPDLWC